MVQESVFAHHPSLRRQRDGDSFPGDASKSIMGCVLGRCPISMPSESKILRYRSTTYPPQPCNLPPFVRLVPP